ncbi:DNAJ DOMAIN CONTAINING PROTEIN EXPRESSED [Salix koriyanagi]|uniref:DNAJ DOMAIN CONTAINING PROTEIN EXPRESSED n=1 Tax=Salix koriyanagi TaxID=2511006 RepID=A0A9Q0TSE1_9ROSI|nr:DNAJ DOMAIN CONTAINING PROTEIN EXPRESSED [Salix koriyanagi]
MDVDHYNVLGLPSGEEGAKLTEKEIAKGYKLKALVLHPDKRPDDPKAHENFQKLKFSYEVLKDEKARKLFDDLLRAKREQRARRGQQDAKRQRMMSDLEERERAAFAVDPADVEKRRVEKIDRELREQVDKIRSMFTNKGVPVVKKEMAGVKESRIEEDEKKILNVRWEKVDSEGYSAERLRELFSKFGEVKDVVIRSTKEKKKRGQALVEMATEEAAVAALGNVFGNLSNPLLVLPYGKKVTATTIPARESDGLNIFSGINHQAYEDSILEKLRKAAENQKQKA